MVFPGMLCGLHRGKDMSGGFRTDMIPQAGRPVVAGGVGNLIWTEVFSTGKMQQWRSSS
jgi:hypothetical protein